MEVKYKKNQETFDKANLLAIIKSDTGAASAAWSLIPGYNAADDNGRRFSDLFDRGFKSNGESVGDGAPCPICGGSDRCRLEDNGAAILCRQGHGNGSPSRTDIFDAVTMALNLSFPDAVNRVGEALHAAGYVGNSSSRPTTKARAAAIKQQLNEAAKAKGRNAPFLSALDTTDAPAPAPQTYKRLPVLPVYLDTSDPYRITPKPTSDAADLPEGLYVETFSYEYERTDGGSFGPKGRAELYDSSGRRYAFYNNGTVVSKIIRNAPGFSLDKAFPYGWQRVKGAARVLIVESEKAADKLNDLYGPNTASICLNGTSGAAQYSRFTSDLQNKDVVICADNDKDLAGEHAASKTAAALFQLTKAGKKDLPALAACRVFVPHALPGKEPFSGYGIDDLIDDLADEEKGNQERIRERLNSLLESDSAQCTPESLQQHLQQQERGSSAPDRPQLPGLEYDQDDGDDIDEAEAIKSRQDAEKHREEILVDRKLEGESLACFEYSRLPETFAYALKAADKYNNNPMAETFPAVTVLTNFIGQKFAVYEPIIHNRPNQRLYPRLHTVLLGGSQSGKSPIINDMTAPIVSIQYEEAKKNARLRAEQQQEQQELDDALAADLAAFKVDAAEARKETGKIPKESAPDFEKRKAELVERKRELKKEKKQGALYDPLFIIDDTSGEAIQVNLAQLQNAGYWNGALVATDEAGGLFSVTNDDKQVLKQFKLYTAIGEPAGTLPNRKTNTTDNVTKYNVTRPLTAGYLFGVQPEIFGKYLNSDILRSQGFANRFFKFYIPDDKPKEKDQFINGYFYNRYAAPFHWLFDLPMEKDEPYVLTLAPGQAKESFKAYKNEIYSRKMDCFRTGLTDEAAFLGKSDDYVLSVAACFHILKLVKDIPAGAGLSAAGASLTIDADTVNLAVDYVKAAIEETLAAMRVVCSYVLHGQPAADPLNAIEQKTLDFILAKGEQGATRSEIRNSINKFKDKRDGAKLEEATLKRLRKKGLVWTDKENKKRGGRFFAVIDPAPDLDDDAGADLE